MIPLRQWRNSFSVCGLACLLAMSVPSARAEDTTSVDTSVDKTAERLHFKVPPDWPIEKRSGVLAPIPIEEYLARKFHGLETQLQSMEQRMNGLDVRLRVLEETTKKPRSNAAGGPG